MIPIRDEIRTHHTPVMNYLLLAANILVFFAMTFLTSNQEAFVYEFALIPANVTSGLDLGDILDMLSSIFMHGGLAHLAGNMLYLWIFGDNVEDSMGSFKYLVFYLIGGAVASAAHVLTNPGSQIPTVGASGAIAAVLGAYLVLYPRARVQTFIPLGFFIRLTVIPASIVLGFWFLLQVFSGLLSAGGPDVGGVAFWAHVGGFVAGVVLAKLFASNHQPQRIAQW